MMEAPWTDVRLLRLFGRSSTVQIGGLDTRCQFFPTDFWSIESDRGFCDLGGEQDDQLRLEYDRKAGKPVDYAVLRQELQEARDRAKDEDRRVWLQELLRDIQSDNPYPRLLTAPVVCDAPLPVQAWLGKKGDEVLARLETADPPLAFGDLETFLTRRIGFALEGGHAVIRNLRRLDIRLGLIALDHNRQLATAKIERILLDRLAMSPPNNKEVVL